MLLLEEYEVAGAQRQLRARYFYADEGDVPLGADFCDGQSMRRHYFMVDRQGSVIGVLDAQGTVVERNSYDPWGRPRIEPRDTEPPEVSAIIGDTNGDVLVVLSEPVITPVVTTATTTIEALLPSLLGLVGIEDSGVPLTTAVRFDLGYPDYTAGSVIRVSAQLEVDQAYTLELEANAVEDLSGNGIAAASIGFTFGTGVLYSGAPLESTRAAPVERSVVGNSLLFQSHLYDYDADLVLARARVLDPRTGMFLQRDPMGYEDSVNLYAGMRWDPINLRDPSGRSAEQTALVKSVSTLEDLKPTAMELCLVGPDWQRPTASSHQDAPQLLESRTF